MKKAKNAFAVIGIIFAVIAAAVLMLHPIVDSIGIEDPSLHSMAYGDYLNQFLLPRVMGGLLNFDWIKGGDIVAQLPVVYPLLVGAVGVLLFVVLFIVLLCKRHAKGLGWFFPMLILFVLSAAVATVYVKPDIFFTAYSAKCNELGCSFNLIAEGLAINQILALVGQYAALASCGFFLLAIIFYMVYACKARKAQKKADSARQAAIAKIDSLLGGNK